MAAYKYRKSKNKKDQKYETKEVLDSLNKVAIDSESFFQKHIKTISIILGVVIIGALGYFSYYNFMVAPKNIDAADALVDANHLFEEGKLDNALGGKSSSILGYSDIVNDFGKSKMGELAALYAGIIEFKKGKYQEALNYFQKFNSSDKDLLAAKYGAIADTYVELNNDEEAMKYLEKAANQSDNQTTIYQFNKKAGILAMALNQNDKALNFFKTIKDKCPDIIPEIGGEIDAYIEKLNYMISG